MKLGIVSSVHFAVRLLAAVSLCVPLSACMTHDPPQEDISRKIEPAPLEWPIGDSDRALALAARMPGRIPTFGALERVDEAKDEPSRSRVIVVNEKAVAGGAVLVDCTIEGPSKDRPRDPPITDGGLRTPNYSAYSRPVPPASESPARFWRVLAPDPNWPGLFDPPAEFESQGYKFVPENPLALRLQRTKEYSAISSLRPDAPPGVVIWFGGIGPSWKLELDSQFAFVRRGFAFVGAMESVLSSFARFRIRLQDLPDDPKERVALILGVSIKGIRDRVTKISVYRNAASAGESLGKEITADVIESASGAEPVLAWLEQQQPDLRSRPLIVVGCSGGVPAAMAFASRHVDRLAGLIIVGGFEDFEQLLARTDLNDGEPTIAWRDDTPLPEQQRQFTEAFQTNCTVDPGRLARAIPSDRVLMIQGRFDTLVPTDLSDRLWESLGRPERWKFFGGHRLLFFRLSAYSRDLADWAETRAAEFSSPPAAPTAAAKQPAK